MWAEEALERFITTVTPAGRVLDVGAGAGEHAARMRDAGLTVTEVDWDKGQDYNTWCSLAGEFDGVWCSHVLEHQQNVGLFLRKLRRDLKLGGVLALTVPPAKHNIVGGHLTIWNAGLLLYNLVMAGWDCREARVGAYGYNISVIVNRVDAILPRLAYDAGDIELLAPFFPIPVCQGFRGDEVRWKW